MGPARKKLLARLGIDTIEQLVSYYPREYNRPNFVSVSALPNLDGEAVVVRGQITSVPVVDRRRARMSLVKCMLTDDTGSVQCIWFNQLYLRQQLARGKTITVKGRYSRRYRTLAVEQQDLSGSIPPAIEPVYPLTKGVSNTALRKIIVNALAGYRANDRLPRPFRRHYGLVDLQQALQAVHCPDSGEELEQGLYRLKFEELFIYQLTFRYWRQLKLAGRGIAHRRFPPLDQLEQAFGFSLTPDQVRAIEQIEADMARPSPMNRLLQGDVGSGKTAVAAYALASSALSGWKGVMMAPTEILAHQHYQTLQSIASQFSLPLALLTGTISPAQRREVIKTLTESGGMIVIGTHAVFQADVKMNQLSLVVTDEQHRFGVRQRMALINKGVSPDVLVMSATPIPRTLAMSIYGDLDLTTLKNKPPGRQEVLTRIIPQSRRRHVLDFIIEQMAAGNCGYIVCPLIEQSEAVEAVSVEEYCAMLARELPQWVKVEMLHGRMDSGAKERAIRRLKGGEVHLLVATTVVEVGVDVPAATFILIENSERYGLAQLHQLRGRVGRSGGQAWCFLIAPPADIARLRVMEKTNDGFKIAQADLEQRGAGQYLGVRQHGFNEFKIANPWQDIQILKNARQAVEAVLPRLSDDDLWQPVQQLVMKNIEKIKS